MAVIVAVDGRNGKWEELPATLAMEVQDDVIAVAVEARLVTAADDAEDLANQIDQTCFTRNG
jgi:hypothetical protein